MGIDVRTIEVEGASLCLRETGDGQDVLVLLHGTEADASMWDPYMEGLARGRRVLAPDLPGHGGTGAPADMDTSRAGIARWFKGILSSEGLDRADVLGHSMGGTVAMLLALEAPELVRRLILVNTGGLCWPAGPLGEEVDLFLQRLVEGEVDEEATRRFVGEVYGWDPEGERAQESARFWMQPGVRAFFGKGGLVYTRPVPVWELRELATETMLIWGEKDRWFPLSTAKEEMMYIPGYRLVVIEGGGHSPFVEAPDLFYLTVDSFLSDGE